MVPCLLQNPVLTNTNVIQLRECSLRTTHTTEANDSSSRSHAICQILLERDGQLRGKLTLVDLAGSERGSDTKSHNSQRRTESAEINTSLLSLKECIRALGQKSSHVPYRGSKLTLLLKDCFSPNSKTTMIATVSPGASSTDHSLNTLRYADRIKEQRTTPSVTVPSSSMKNAGGTLSPKPQGPTKQRLQLIASVSEMTAARRDEAADEVLAHENRTLTQTGLAEAAAISPSPAFIDEDDDEDEDDDATLERLMTDDPEEFEQELEDMEYETSRDNDDEDEDYDPAEEEEEEEEEDLYQKVNSIQQDEEEMRIIVQDLFELEEALLNQHMSNIQENAEMLTHEGKLLQSVQGASEDEMDEYAIQLAEYLDRKEILVYKLQQKLGEFKSQLAKEQEMAQRVHSLSQY